MTNHAEPILGAYIKRKVVNANQHQQLLFGTTKALNRFYGYSALLLLNSEIHFDTSVPTACVGFKNNRYIYTFNPVYLTQDGMTLDHIIFAVCHEGLHRALQHMPLTFLYCGKLPHSLPGVPVPPFILPELSDDTKNEMFPFDGQDFLPFDQRTFMIALDHIVNALLVRDGIGQLHPNWIQPDQVDLTVHTEEAVYALVYNDQSGNGGWSHGGDPQDEFSIIDGNDLPLDTPTTQQAIQNAREHGISTVIEGQKLIGNMPGSLERFLEKMKAAQVDWTERLISSVMQNIAGNDETSFNRLDRRFAAVTGVIIPTMVAFRNDSLVVALDTSGSVSNQEMRVFMTEIAGIAHQMRPQRIVVLPCDARVHDAVYIETPDGLADFDAIADDVLATLEGHVTGGGGTSFVPPFDWVTNNMSDVPIEAFIYMTDGYGSAPASAPEYPVYWVTTGSVDFVQWGEVIPVHHG